MIMGLYVGVLKPEAHLRLEEYQDRAFEFFEDYYEVHETGVLPPGWRERLGPSTQMDWGSWLYVCTREVFRALPGIRGFHFSRIIPAAEHGERALILPDGPFESLPDGERYGVYEVEIA